MPVRAGSHLFPTVAPEQKLQKQDEASGLEISNCSGDYDDSLDNAMPVELDFTPGQPLLAV